MIYPRCPGIRLYSGSASELHFSGKQHPPFPPNILYFIKERPRATCHILQADWQVGCDQWKRSGISKALVSVRLSLEESVGTYKGKIPYPTLESTSLGFVAFLKNVQKLKNAKL